MLPSEILTEAAKLIEQRGHAKHVFVDKCGALCVMGAIRLAAGQLPFGWGSYESDHATKLLWTDLCIDSKVSHWNDEFMRTKEQVVLALRNAAEKAKGDGE